MSVSSDHAASKAVGAAFASDILRSDPVNVDALIEASRAAKTYPIARRLADRAVDIARGKYELSGSPVPASGHPDGLRLIQALLARADACDPSVHADQLQLKIDLVQIRAELDKGVDALRSRERLMTFYAGADPAVAAQMLQAPGGDAASDAWTGALNAWAVEAVDGADRLDRAIEMNPHVPGALIAHRDGVMPASARVPAEPGSEGEARLYADAAGALWSRMGATIALEAFIAARDAPKPSL